MSNIARSLHIGGIAIGLAGLLAGVAAASEGVARVTAVVGSAQRGSDQPLEALAGVAEDEPIATAEDGGCALLLEEDALVELCGNSSLRVRRRVPGEPRVLEVKQGKVRVSAETRLGDERIEIHTPAVIATIMGTVVFVSVDALGVTTITSEVSKVMVGSASPTVIGTTLIEGGEQLVVKPGEAPPAAPERLQPKALAALGGCLVDFHHVALEADRAKNLARVTDSIAESDALDVELPQVAALDPTGGSNLFGPDSGAGGTSDNTGGNEIYTPADVNPDVQEEAFNIIDPPGPPGGDDDFPEDCPGGIPGEQCGPF